MQIIRMFLLLATLTLLSVSCQKEGAGKFDDVPVVESYLSPGHHIRVTVSYKTPYDESVISYADDISNLDIIVITGGTEYHLIPAGNGIYEDTLGRISVMPDSTYSLHFVYNDLQVTSTTIIPYKPQDVTQSDTVIKMSQFDPDNPSGNTQPDPVEITWSNSDEDYYLVTVECMEQDLVPIIKDSVPANDIFASQPITGTSLDIQPMMFRYFGKNRIILYHINPEYSIFFMRQASSSQNYEEPPSNISNGLGIFTGINADTLYIRIIQQ